MANFKKIVEKVFDVEKGYQKNPKDSGNYTNSGRLVGTNYGISAKAYEQYYGKEPTEREMRELKKSEAYNILKQDYWDRIQGDKIKNESIAHIVFDIFVNAYGNGLKRVREAIKTYNKNTYGVFVSAKSSLTDSEIEWINSAKNKKELFEAIKERELKFRKFANPEFKDGWIKRYENISYTNDTKQKLKKVATGAAIVVLPVGLTLLFFAGKLLYNKYYKK